METWDRHLYRRAQLIAGMAFAIVLTAWLLRWSAGPWSFEPSGDGHALTSEVRTQALNLETLRLSWTEGYWLGQDDPLYRPMTTTSLVLVAALERAVGAPTGGLQVMTNVGLHLLNAYLALLVLSAAFRRRSVALLAVTLWAVHPGHVEAVVGIAGRADLLAMACGLFACVLSQRGRWLPSAVLALLATLSKESGCFFFAAPIILTWGRGRFSWESVKRQVVVCAFGALAVMALQVWRQSESPGYFIPFGDNPLVVLSAPERMAAAAHLLFTQGGRWFIDGMAFFDGSYATPEITCFITPGMEPGMRWLSLLALVVLAYAALVSIDRAPLPSFCLLWFLGAVLPASNLIFPIGTAWGDRLLYIPSLGVFLFGASCLFSREAHSPEPRRWIAKADVAVAAIIAAIGALMFQAKAQAFRNNDTLVMATYPHASGSYRYLTGMAQVHLKVASLPGHGDHLAKAEAFALDATGLWLNSGRALWQQDERPFILLAHVYLARHKAQPDPVWLERAERQLRQALMIGEAKGAARATVNGGQRDGSAALTYISSVKALVSLLCDHGNLPGAEALLRQAIAVAPIVVDFHTGLGVVLTKQGRASEARTAFLRACILRRQAHLLAPAEREEALREVVAMRASPDATAFSKLRARLDQVADDFRTP